MTLDGDWEYLAKLEREVYPIADCITGEQYYEYYEKGNIVWVLINDKGEWVANFQIAPVPEDSPLPFEKGQLYITGIAVFKPYQGKGFGHQIMECLLEKYRAHSLICRVRQENIRSQSLISQYKFIFQQPEVKDGTTWYWYCREPDSY